MTEIDSLNNRKVLDGSFGFWPAPRGLALTVKRHLASSLTVNLRSRVGLGASANLLAFLALTYLKLGKSHQKDNELAGGIYGREAL
jgi:hypothetical protein